MYWTKQHQPIFQSNCCSAFQIAAKRSREKKMERLRLLKDEYKQLTRKDKELNRQRQVALSNKDAVLYHLNKMEFEIKRLREK